MVEAVEVAVEDVAEVIVVVEVAEDVEVVVADNVEAILMVIVAVVAVEPEDACAISQPATERSSR